MITYVVISITAVTSQHARNDNSLLAFDVQLQVCTTRCIEPGSNNNIQIDHVEER